MNVAPAAQPNYPILSAADAKKLRVPELRAALQARGQITDGVRADLLERLLPLLATPGK